MKQKIIRDWNSREKTTEELHEDAKNWLSEIQFVKDEIRFLNHLLASNYINFLDKGLASKIKEFTTGIRNEDEVASLIIKSVSEHEKSLGKLIKTKSVTSNTHFLQQHKEIDKLVTKFYKKYKMLKKKIFNTVEDVMRKKGMKRISKSS